MLDIPPIRTEDTGNWQPVRDSWVDGDMHGAHTEPPPLPPSVREAPAARSAEDTAFADLMLERLAASDYAGALTAAEALLRSRPTDADALDCAQMCRAELERVFVSRLGSLDRVPRLAIDARDVETLGLDLRAAAVLACVDGAASLGEIVRSSPEAAFDVLRILSELFLRRVVAF